MEDLQKKFEKLKSRITAQEADDKEFRTVVHRILSEVCGGEKKVRQYIVGLSKSKNSIIIATNSKAFAQELFMRKEVLEQALGRDAKLAPYRLIIK